MYYFIILINQIEYNNQLAKKATITLVLPVNNSKKFVI